jgi:hypothetical protein
VFAREIGEKKKKNGIINTMIAKSRIFEKYLGRVDFGSGGSEMGSEGFGMPLVGRLSRLLLLYSCLFLLSNKISLASFIALSFSSACSENPGLLSGWYFLAKSR